MTTTTDPTSELTVQSTPTALEEHELAFGDQRVPYFVGEDCASSIAASIEALEPDHLLVVTDDNVQGFAGALLAELGARMRTTVLSSSPGEGQKSLGLVDDYLHRSIAAGATRRSVVVALGGGVSGNIAGVVAGLLFRGVRLVHVPTTLASAADSVLSFKQAVNSTYGKNQIGLYVIPSAIHTDLAFFRTLSARDVRAGLAEAVKNALAIDATQLPEFTERVLRQEFTPDSDTLRWLLRSCIAAKSTVMRTDSHERGHAVVLEYGHTVGHALELCEQQRRGAAGLSHGESIAFGMIAAARIAQALGLLDDEQVRLHERFVERIGAPTRIPDDITPAELIAFVERDNKRGQLAAGPDEFPFVLLRGFGDAVRTGDMPLVNVQRPVLEAVLDSLR